MGNKEVVITLGQSREAMSALSGFASIKIRHGLNFKFVMAMKRAMDELKKENDRASEVMQEAGAEYLQKDKDGNPVPSEDGSGYKVREDKRAEYIKKMEEVLSVEYTMMSPIDRDLLEEFLDSIGEDEEVLSIAHVLMVLPITV